MSCIKFDIQHFSDEEEKKASGENTPSDAGEEKEVSAEKKNFDELIRGEYRDEYGKKVEEIVKKRIKDHAELKKDMEHISGALDELKSQLGIEAEKPEEIISAIREKLKAERRGADAQGADPNQEGAEKGGSDRAKLALAKLIQNVGKAKELYPQFDLKREMSDPRFRRMLALTGNDPKKSFEILHHDEIMAAAVRDAARMTEEKLAGSIASKAKRPSEGASVAAASIFIDEDPKSLTKEQRADIKRRVRRGEKISWS